MYQYSRAIYRSIKDLIDPYVTHETRLEYRREVLQACEQTMERLATENELSAYRHTGFWQAMDTLRDRNLLEQLWADGRAPWRAW